MADSSEATAAATCKKIRFLTCDDVLLLRELVTTNSYEDALHLITVQLVLHIGSNCN